MTLTFACVVTIVLVVMLCLAICSGDDEAPGIFFFLLLLWVILGLGLAGHVGENPDYPVTYFNTKVLSVADIPSNGFILFLEQNKEQRFTAIADLPLHDAKEIVYEYYKDTYGNPINLQINMKKTLELLQKK